MIHLIYLYLLVNSIERKAFISRSSMSKKTLGLWDQHNSSVHNNVKPNEAESSKFTGWILKRIYILKGISGDNYEKIEVSRCYNYSLQNLLVNFNIVRKLSIAVLI